MDDRISLCRWSIRSIARAGRRSGSPSSGRDSPAVTAAALAAKAATTTIPIVFTIGSDPVASGLVDSLEPAGRQPTGVTLLTARTANEAAGTASRDGSLGHHRVAVLDQPDQSHAEVLSRDLPAAARHSACSSISSTRAPNASSTTRSRPCPTAEPARSWSAPAAFFNSRSQQLAALPLRHAVPSVFSRSRDFAEAGGLMSYGASLADAYRLAGVYVGRILKGAKPADLPVAAGQRRSSSPST